MDNNFKELPKNIVCEQELLTYLLNSKYDISEVIDKIDEEDFYGSSHKIIFRAIKELFANGKEINLTLMIESIGREKIDKAGGISYITELMMNAVIIKPEEHIKILKDKSYRRSAIHEFNIALKKLYDEKIKPVEMADILINKLFDNAEKTSVMKDCDLLKKALSEVEERMKNGGKTPGMETGFKGIDRNIGGLNRGELDIIAGRPSMGKTLFALNLADGLGSNNYKTLLCELEMTEKSIGMRRLSFNAEVEAEKMKFGKVNDEEADRILQTSDKLIRRNNMFTDCSPLQSLFTIRAKAKSIKERYGLDVIVIDHLNLMDIGKRETRDIAIGEVTRGLKSLAKEFDVCIILICQLSRNVEQRKDKRPMLSDLRESGNIEQDADIVMLLYRDEYYDRFTKEKGVLECIIGKQRNGRIGTIKFGYDEKFQKIYDL